MNKRRRFIAKRRRTVRNCKHLDRDARFVFDGVFSHRLCSVCGVVWHMLGDFREKARALAQNEKTA